MAIDFFGPAGSQERRDFLAENPRVAFFSFQDQFGKAPAQQRFFANAYAQLHDRFLGNLGQQIRTGQEPTANFVDYLGSPNFFSNFYAQSTPYERGDFQRARLAPSTRFLFNF